MDHELEVIRGQMEATRESLADKLGELESQVRETVQVAGETVTNTVDGVKEVVSSVTDTVASTVESVKDTFNVRKHFEEHPWTALGAAVGLGLAGGLLLDSPGRTPASAAAPASAPSSPRPSEPGVMTNLLHNLQGLAFGSLLSMARDYINEAAPEQWKEGLSNTLDDLTFQLTGEKPSKSSQGSFFATKTPEDSTCDDDTGSARSGHYGNGSRLHS